MPADTSLEQKLKQARLPFSPVDPKTQKKRKLSNESETRSPKILCSESASTSERASEIKPDVDSKDSAVDIKVKNISTTVEGKENIKSKSSEPVLFGGEESCDSIEIVAVKESSKDLKKKQNNVGLDSNKSPTQQRNKNAAPKSKAKRKRSSSVKPSSPSNSIKKMFKDVEGKNDVSPKVSTDTKLKSGKTSDSDNESKDTSVNKSSFTDSSICLSSDNEANPEVESVESERASNISTVSPPQSQAEVTNEVEKSKPMIVTTPLPKKAVTNIRKLVSKQKLPNEFSKKKEEEKLKLKTEKEKLKKEKEIEKQKQKEEREKKKLEEIEAKEEKKQKREEERLKREEKKEEERLKKEEEKLKKEEEKQKKEEEKQKKEEEKQKKEEEKLLAEEEEREKQNKLKAKFAQFFVPKKVEMPLEQNETVVSADNFVHFRVKENMKIAPIVRSLLSDERKMNLEKFLSAERKRDASVHYLADIKRENYVRGTTRQTFPILDKTEADDDDDDDDCEIISDEEEIDGTDVLEVKSSPSKIVRAKFLQFCENSRPAYYGTWSKKPASISGRRPFAKEQIFDYEYDSDEDWEDVENGESLSDSDGEGEEGTKEEMYEVDNDFFVPHGYLSDGEGEDDDEGSEAKEEEGEKEKDENLQKEKLKQKQEEFELEMKKQTKQLKPKVFGCVWLGDKSSHQAYDQILKLLLPHRSVVMFGSCPIDVSSKEMNNHELKDDDEESHEDESTKKFVKNFPEAAVPDLIRLIHGNRHSKLFLIREFSEYWKNKLEETETDPSNTGFIAMRKIEPKIQIAMRKIEPKIQEIGQYGRFSENGVSFRYRTWYVSKEVREKYGLEDLSLNNSWNYTLPVKDWKKDDSKEEKQEDVIDEQIPKTQPKAPFTGTNLITKFTKVLNAEEDKKKFNVSSPSPSTSESPSSDSVKTPLPKRVAKSPMVTPSNSGKRGKSKANVPSAGKEEKTVTPKPKNSIMAMFKNMEKGRKSVGKNSSSEQEGDLGCITLD